MTGDSQIILCRLCDKNGIILNAYKHDSIKFTELTLPENRSKRRIRSASGRIIDVFVAKILIEGYVSVCIDERNLSAPIAFRIEQQVCINTPEKAVLNFAVNNFICQAVPARDGLDYIRISIIIETRVNASIEKNIDSDEDPPVSIEEIIDTVRMISRTCIFHRADRIKAEAYQYTALSNGEKRVYTNEDELKKYGDKGILSPNEVSYYNLYVNGVLQPKVNYIMTKGKLEFITEDIPTRGATVIIKYIILKGNNCINFTDDQYYTIADGIKREYTNEDELKKYSTNGIPGSDEVSYYNLYVNGVLQPKKNYIVKKGLLKFTTADIPQEGHSIIIESIAVKDACGRFMEVEVYQCDTRADKSRIYCTGNDITPYGKGIIAPQRSTYQNLLVNAVNQPDVNYKVCGGCLIFNTADLPTAGSPLTLQSIRILNNNDSPIPVINLNKHVCRNSPPAIPLNIYRHSVNLQPAMPVNKKSITRPCKVCRCIFLAALLVGFGRSIS